MAKIFKYGFFIFCAALCTIAVVAIIVVYTQTREISGPGGEFYLEASDKQSSLSSEQRIELYNKAIQLEPNNSLYIFNRGTFFFYLGNFKNAYPDLKKSSEMIDGLDKPRRLFLKALCEGELQLYAEAEEDFKLAISLLPGDGGGFGAQLHGGLALTQIAMREYEKALETIEISIRLEPRGSHWMYLKAMALACLDKEHEAEKIFNNTAAKQITQSSDGKIKSIFFDGKKELLRIKKCSAEEISNHWDQGDRWRYDTGIEHDYGNFP